MNGNQAGQFFLSKLTPTINNSVDCTEADWTVQQSQDKPFA